MNNSHIDQAVKRYLERTGYERIDLGAALFDMDGTLYDSMPRHADAWHAMMLEQGIDWPRDAFFEYEGRTGASTIDIIFEAVLGRTATDEEVERLYHRKTEFFQQYQAAQGIQVMPAAQQVVHTMMQAGATPVLVTGSGQSSMIDRLNHDYPGAFDADKRITARDVTNGKPHPEPYLRAMALAGAQPWQCIVIENAPLGVESGHRAGIFTVAVATGPIPTQKLAQAGADIVFESMQQFNQALPHLLSLIKG